MVLAAEDFLVPGAYLFGSVSFSVIYCRLLQKPDPRHSGSLNPGATNAMRVGGKLAGFLTLISDIAKGMIPVYLAIFLDAGPSTVALTALAAFGGHIFPVFHNFRGGKGVATLCGCILPISFLSAVLWGCCWLICVGCRRYVAAGSVLACLYAPLFLAMLDSPLPIVIAFFIMGVTVLLAHRSNINNIITGRENKVGGLR